MTDEPTDDDPPLEVRWDACPTAVTRVAPSVELAKKLESRFGPLRMFALRLKTLQVTSTEVEEAIAILLDGAPDTDECIAALRDWTFTLGLLELAIRLAEQIFCLLGGKVARREYARRNAALMKPPDAADIGCSSRQSSRIEASPGRARGAAGLYANRWSRC
jgi:hypothetical protein